MGYWQGFSIHFQGKTTFDLKKKKKRNSLEYVTFIDNVFNVIINYTSAYMAPI